MPQRLRGLGVLIAAGLATGGLTACGLVQGETFEDEAALSGRITSVRIDNDAGSVTVNGTDDGRLTVHREIEYRGDEPDGATHRIEDGELYLGGCGNRCSVRYTVDVPTGVPVRGEVSSGTIHVADVGAVNVTTDSGRIELSRVTGPVQVRTSNGRITGEDIEGPRIAVETSNGDITLTSRSASDVRAKTSNGDVTVTVPEADYRVTVRTSNGDTDIQVPDDPSAAHRLDLSTSSGDISVLRAPEAWR
ncbi:hypothetical protein GCM10023347_08240 [Streptomyces chumphonensis]|uniref:DUF4097 family beta strand repeat protein n=1 Tax=Streptomyces chumphonensis TaxID=1214925 RepID=A0A927IE77_9ACTN|nr:DUF4097 family beta strand repeat-containing protein [Streptomyces chumphonensis]MBD3933061.1 DUF4097 family beta strand repeat protein [Streptomyces chumphonensis]